MAEFDIQQLAVGGRVRVRAKGGGPLTLRTSFIQCANQPAFSQASEIFDLNAGSDGEAPFARGQVEVVAQVPESVPNILWLEVNVLGLLGSTATILARFALSPIISLGRLSIWDPFDAIAFEARQVLDGVGDATADPPILGFTAVGRFWR